MSDYKIDRYKFFDMDEKRFFLNFVENKAIEDKKEKRKTWIVRWMLADLAIYSGLRVSELAGLKIKDLKLDTSNPYLRVRDGKGGKDRDVYIRKELVNHLRKFIAIKAQWNQPTKPESPLFTGRKGKHYTATALSISFKTAIKECPGLRDNLSIHSARHTFATYTYAATKNMKFVQKQLGHANMNMSQHYADVLPSENGKLANMIF